MSSLKPTLLLLAEICSQNNIVRFNEITEVKNWSDNISINDFVDIRQIKTDQKYRSNKTTCLCIACQFASVNIVEQIIRLGASSDICDGFGDSPLHKACRSSIQVVEKLKLLITYNCSLINKVNRKNESPLHLAVLNKNDAIISTLCENKIANINACTGNLLTPLHVACYFGVTKNLPVLLKQPNIDVNAQDVNGDTPLHLAARRGNNNILSLLKSHRLCRTTLRNKLQYTADQENPLNIALLEKSEYGSLGDVIRLLEEGAICVTDINDETPLHKAIRSKKDSLKKVKVLLKFDPSLINARAKTNATALHIASKNENTEILSYLLNFHKVEVNAFTKRLFTPLHVASNFGCNKSLKILLKHEQVDKDVQDFNGDTACHHAIFRGHYKSLVIIVKQNASQVNIPNKAGIFPLHVAARHRDVRFINFLLNKVIDINARTGKRLTALHIASHFGLRDNVRILLRHNAIDVNAIDIHGNTPLHHASFNENDNIINIIKRNSNCNQHILNHCGLTADQVKPLNVYLLTKSQFGTISDVESFLHMGAVCVTDIFGDTPLHKACRASIDATEKAKLLIEFEPTQIYKENKSGCTPLHIAARRNDAEVLKLLLKQNGIGINKTTSQRLTPLHIAASFGREETIRIFLNQKNTDVNYQDHNGDTAAHHAAYNSHQKCLSLLQLHPCYKVYLTNNAGKTADEDNPLNTSLMRICMYGNALTVLSMLRAGAKCLLDEDGNTLLHISVNSTVESQLKCEILLDSNPQLINIKNRNKETVFHLAAKKDDKNVFKFLLGFSSFGINLPNLIGETALHISVRFDITENVQCLLSNEDVNINLQDHHGNTASHIAAKRRNHEIFFMIQECPEFQSKIKNHRNETASKIWRLYQEIGYLATVTWIICKEVEIDHYTYSLSLVRGNIYCTHKMGVQIFNQGLEHIDTILKGLDVFEVVEFGENALLASSRTGIYILNVSGAITTEIKSGKHDSAKGFGSRVFASKRHENESPAYTSVDHYEYNGTWQKISETKLSCSAAHIVTLFVDSKFIYACCFRDNEIHVLSHDGALQQKIILDIGYLLPWLCSVDKYGNMLLADYGNGMKVLVKNGQSLPIQLNPTIERPKGCVYVDGRLFVSSIDQPKNKISLFLENM